MEQKNQKSLLVLRIIAFKPGSTNSCNPEQDTCHWHSICYQATLRFHISLRQVYSKPGSLGVTKKQVKLLSRTFSKSLAPFGVFDCSKGILKRCFLESELTKSLTVCNFRNKVGMTTIFFFKMFKM